MAATQRPQFGGRVLRDEEEVYTENAWDNVEWSEEQLTAARAAVDNQAQRMQSRVSFVSQVSVFDI